MTAGPRGSTRRQPTGLSLALAAIMASVGLPAAPLAAQQAGVDIQRYRYEITLPDTGRHIAVAATIEFARDRAVSELRLDLLAPMRVSRARRGCGAAPATAPFSQDSQAVVVTLGAATTGLNCVHLEYAGAPADGLVISTDSAGRWRAFGDNWPNRARHWLASIDHPSDKALVEFSVLAPAGLSVVANGILVESSLADSTATDESRSGGSRTGGAARPDSAARARTTWKTLFPIPTYLMVIAAAPLELHALGLTACGLGGVERCVPQQVFTAPEQARYMPGNFKFADDIVRFFARTVGPFPYAQLAHLQSSTRFGGMENAGAIFYADRLFREPNGVSVGLIAHETAHQWFGDAVTEREWAHLWLSEGFATYFAALYTEYGTGPEAFRTEMADMRGAIIGDDVVAQRPVLDTAQTELMALLNTNSYQKGGFVLHMLRSEVGDSAFFRGIRAYWAAHRHGNALTPDLRAAVEQAAGRELGWFFDQWLTRPGYAELTTGWTHDPVSGQVALTVDQGARFGAFRFTLRVAVDGADGDITLVRVEVPAEPTARVVLPGRWSTTPRAVRVDPYNELLASFATTP